MLRAAYDLFCDGGYVGTTMKAIAERAGVAVQTLYFTFNTKSTILNEAIGAAVVGFDVWDPKMEQAVSDEPRTMVDFHPWYTEFCEAPTAPKALAVFVDASLHILDRVGPLIVVMTGSADADVLATLQTGEHRRATSYGFAAEELAKLNCWRDGVTLQQATDILLTILSSHTHTYLRRERGWSLEQCREWYIDVLCHQLLQPPNA